MRALIPVSRTIAAIVVLLVSGCSASGPISPAAAVLPAVPTPTFSFELQFEKFNPLNFSHPQKIDNPWFPLKPGTQMTYEGTTVENGETVPHRIVFTVTDLTKVVSGIPAAVVWDRDYSGSALVEAELAFFAQDNQGAVWHLGQYPEEYEGGKRAGAPTWIHGIQDASAGITMQADPRLGTRDYSEGWGPAVNWTDRARVDQVGQKVCTALKCYENVLVIIETSESEPGAYQLKYYAPGIGNIQTGWKGNDQTQETLELTGMQQLNPEGLAEARAAARELEASAYQVSTDVYAKTQPIQ